MQGDFSRMTFDATKHFSRVLMQQGRVQLDADWNEQTAILLHYLQTLAADLIGPYGGPGDGFTIKPFDGDKNDFIITAGHYYVDGILCELNPTTTYKCQDDYRDVPDLEKNHQYLVYLDVWERHITCIEDDSIREVALGGPDTATRAKVVWQVKVEPTENIKTAIESDWKKKNKNLTLTVTTINDRWETMKTLWQPRNRGLLKAKAQDAPSIETNPCITSPEARYRGAENQLYRVEIHTDGTNGTATFKWSRDNGSVIFPVRELTSGMIKLEHLGRDSHLSLAPNDWVELIDDDMVLGLKAGNLLQVQTINRDDLTITFTKPETVVVLPIYSNADNSNDYKTKHVLLRRWDYKREVETGKPAQTGELAQPAPDGALLIKEGNWLTLENGVQICFEPASSDPSHCYHTGDYWFIPARTVTGDVELPSAVGPHGVEHHYAPLAVISLDTNKVEPCQRVIELCAKPV